MSNKVAAASAGPSEMVADSSGFPRWAGSFGLFLAIFGFLTIALSFSGNNVRINPAYAGVALVTGLAAMLFHASFERDDFLRRPYLAMGLMFLATGLGLVAMPFFRENTMAMLPGHGLLILGMMFVLAVLRQESNEGVAGLAATGLGISAIGLVLVGALGGAIQPKFLLPHFMMMGLTGTILMAAYISVTGAETRWGYQAGVALGWIGLIGLIVALGRSMLPQLAYTFNWIGDRPGNYWVPTGFLLSFLGLFQWMTSAFLISESRLLILTRREMGSFFFSPIAYIVLLSFVLSTWVGYSTFLDGLVFRAMSAPPTEPIVRNYVISLFTVLSVLFAVPLLTMRLLSEEKRTATLEVLLTAPVDETTVVFAKFLAGLLVYLMVWIPYLVYLLALPVGGAPEFDYRPLLSFFMGLVATGAGFIAVGLFFSSLSSNQIVSAALTLAYMIFMLLLYIIHFQPSIQNTIWARIIEHTSFLDLWETNLQGKLIPRQLLFHLSMTVLALFGTVKVLEARKWS